MTKLGFKQRIWAARNLLNFGFDPAVVPGILEQWEKNQIAKTAKNISESIKPAVVHFSKNPPGELKSKLYVSFHYSLYQVLFVVIARLQLSGTIAALVSKHAEKHLKCLQGLGAEHGIKIEFIQSGSSMIRTARRHLANNVPVILLADVPWGNSARLDAKYPVDSGEFLGLSSLNRLINLIDPEPTLLLIDESHPFPRLHRLGDFSIGNAFVMIEKFIFRNPHMYERLDDCHNYFLFKRNVSVLVKFRVNNDVFYWHTNGEQFWKETRLTTETHALGVKAKSDFNNAEKTVAGMAKQNVEYILSI